MVLIIVAIVLLIAGMMWLWRGPVSQSANSLQEGGSTKTESYVLIILLVLVMAGTVYMILRVV